MNTGKIHPGRIVYILISVSLFALLISCGTTHKPEKDATIYRIYGGPSGGTFRHFAEGLAVIARKSDIRLKPISSKGSYENVRRVDSGTAGFAIAYASHVYQARHGLLRNDSRKYENILAVGYLYGAQAQLVVKKESGMTSADQLTGQRVGVGKKYSGMAIQAELFFRQLGIWDFLTRKCDSYNETVEVFNADELDAFWLFTGYPSGAVIKASKHHQIDLINLYQEGEKFGFFQKHPYFEPATIPGNTYKGVLHDTHTYQDSALWIVNRHVPADVVYALLKQVYSQRGVDSLAKEIKIAKEMGKNNGEFGISTPLHPGAVQYYHEQRSIPAE